MEQSCQLQVRKNQDISNQENKEFNVQFKPVRGKQTGVAIAI